MKTRNWNKMLLLSALVVLVMAGGAVSVFAQSDPVTPVPGSGGMRGFDFHGGMHGPGGDSDRQADLAAALGITVEELQAAQQKAQAARLAQAVEDGFMTQDQANLMLAMQALHGALDHETILAEALGLSVDELQAAREAGTLRELLANITPAELQSKMQAAWTAAVQQAVTDNVITQEQADLVLAQMAEHMSLGFGGMRGFGGGGHGRGGMHGFGGMRGFDSALPDVLAPASGA